MALVRFEGFVVNLKELSGKLESDQKLLSQLEKKMMHLIFLHHREQYVCQNQDW